MADSARRGAARSPAPAAAVGGRVGCPCGRDPTGALGLPSARAPHLLDRLRIRARLVQAPQAQQLMRHRFHHAASDSLRLQERLALCCKRGVYGARREDVRQTRSEELGQSNSVKHVARGNRAGAQGEAPPPGHNGSYAFAPAGPATTAAGPARSGGGRLTRLCPLGGRGTLAARRFPSPPLGRTLCRHLLPCGIERLIVVRGAHQLALRGRWGWGMQRGRSAAAAAEWESGTAVARGLACQAAAAARAQARAHFMAPAEAHRDAHRQCHFRDVGCAAAGAVKPGLLYQRVERLRAPTGGARRRRGGPARAGGADAGAAGAAPAAAEPAHGVQELASEGWLGRQWGRLYRWQCR
jgi:hypothetical protein